MSSALQMKYLKVSNIFCQVWPSSYLSPIACTYILLFRRQGNEDISGQNCGIHRRKCSRMCADTLLFDAAERSLDQPHIVWFLSIRRRGCLEGSLKLGKISGEFYIFRLSTNLLMILAGMWMAWSSANSNLFFLIRHLLPHYLWLSYYRGIAK